MYEVILVAGMMGQLGSEPDCDPDHYSPSRYSQRDETVIFSQLPDEKCCEWMFQRCSEDCCLLNNRLGLVGGWQREMILDRLHEARRIKAIWYAAWCCTFESASDAYAWEWSCNLRLLVGEEIFWTGHLPLPLSCR